MFVVITWFLKVKFEHTNDQTSHLSILHLTTEQSLIYSICTATMGTGIGYPNEARARMKGRYGTEGRSVSSDFTD